MEIILPWMFICAINIVFQAITSIPMVLLSKKKVTWYEFELLIFILPFICHLCVAILADFDIFFFLIGTNLSSFILEQLILAGLIPVLVLLKILVSLKLYYKKKYSIIVIIILCAVPIFFRTFDFIFVYD
ncbi:MAG: hypothetical protein KAS96_11280 [Planctomycetes bacterium]|nr:hypothetical protein [Planctomycetota bacterium]